LLRDASSGTEISTPGEPQADSHDRRTSHQLLGAHYLNASNYLIEDYFKLQFNEIVIIPCKANN